MCMRPRRAKQCCPNQQQRYSGDYPYTPLSLHAREFIPPNPPHPFAPLPHSDSPATPPRTPAHRLQTSPAGVLPTALKRHRLPGSHTCTCSAAVRSGGVVVAHLGSDLDIQAEMQPAPSKTRSRRTSQSARRPAKRPKPSRNEDRFHRGPLPSLRESRQPQPQQHDTLGTLLFGGPADAIRPLDGHRG
jgi:hypothetical protein